MRPFDRALQGGRLLTKRQVLKGNSLVTAADQTGCSEEDNDRRQHELSCCGFSDGSNRRDRLRCGRTGCCQSDARLIAGLGSRQSSTRRRYMSTMRAVQVSKPGGSFEMVEREVPQPTSRQVRVKVQACGLC